MKRSAAVTGTEEKGLPLLVLGWFPNIGPRRVLAGTSSPRVLPRASAGSLSTAREAQSTAAPPAPGCVWELQPNPPEHTMCL